MITVFTGAPGAGKTASLVQFLASLPGDRLLFVDGLDGLTLPHQVVDANNWHAELPDGAILVIDEVQRIWRPRPAGSKVPQSVAELETHRHRGIDVFVTTQSPKLLDSNVRALVGRHVHIRDTGILGRWWYEWPEISEQCAWKTCVIKKRVKLDKKAFALYRSASIHTVPVRTIPPALYVGIGALFLLLVLGYFVTRIYSKTQVPVVPPAMTAASGAAPVHRPGAGGVYSLRTFEPRVRRKPESAPAYDEIRVVRSMPLVVGGYCQQGRCYCVTQQGTSSGLTDDECAAWIDNPPFNPYREAERLDKDSGQQQQQAKLPEPKMM